MKKTLEELWYSHLIESTNHHFKEEKELLEKISEKHTALQTELDQGQKATLEEWENLIWNLCSISEKNAFIEGVRFTTSFLWEAMSEKE